MDKQDEEISKLREEIEMKVKRTVLIASVFDSS